MDGLEWSMDGPPSIAFAENHFDTMYLGSFQWENYPVNAIQGFKNAGMTPIGYTRLCQVQYSPTPAYCSADWVELILMKIGSYTTQSLEAEYGIPQPVVF